MHAITCSCLGETCKASLEGCVITGEAGNLEYTSCESGKVGVLCRCGACLIACGAATNLADYLYGGGEGCILGGCYLALFRGTLIKGPKICKNKCIDKHTACCCNKQLTQRGTVTLCLSKKGFPTDSYPSKKAEKVAESGDKKFTKIRLCCLTTTFMTTGPITVAYNGC